MANQNNNISVNSLRRKLYMCKRIVMGTTLTALIIIFAIIFYSYWVEWRFDRETIESRYNVEHYENYYYKLKYFSRHFIYTHNYKKIYFLPGQRDLLLEKIEEDINNELTNIVEQNKDAFHKYEISDDFMRVSIYETSNDITDRNERKHTVKNNIESKIELYIRIKHKRRMGFGNGEGITFLEEDISCENE